MKINNQQSLLELIESEFPIHEQESWDFCGFSFQAKSEKDLKIMITLDVDKKAILKAIEKNISIILSHHPFCFASSKMEAIEIDYSKKELFTLLEDNNISVYALHTTFDRNKKGSAYYLLKKMGLLEKIIKEYQFETIINYSASFSGLINLLKEKLELNFLISNWNQSTTKIINKIYFAPGAGDIYQFIKYNKKDQCDLLITSDIKWNEQILLQNLGINFIIISHKIEEVFIDGMLEFLKDKLADDVELILDYKNNYLTIY